MRGSSGKAVRMSVVTKGQGFRLGDRSRGSCRGRCTVSRRHRYLGFFGRVRGGWKVRAARVSKGKEKRGGLGFSREFGLGLGFGALGLWVNRLGSREVWVRCLLRVWVSLLRNWVYWFKWAERGLG